MDLAQILSLGDVRVLAVELQEGGLLRANFLAEELTELPREGHEVRALA